MARAKAKRAFLEGADWEAILAYLQRYQSMDGIAADTGISRQTLWRYSEGKMTPRVGNRAKLMESVTKTASVYGSVPDAVTKDLEAAGVIVKDRVPDVLNV